MNAWGTSELPPNTYKRVIEKVERGSFQQCTAGRGKKTDHGRRMKDDKLKLKQGKFILDIMKTFFTMRDGQALEQAALEGYTVSILRGFQDPMG